MRTLSQRDYVSVQDSDSVAEALKLLATTEVQFAVVLSGERLIGVFSGGDLIRALALNFDYQVVMSSRVSEYCNLSPLKVSTKEISSSEVEEFKRRRIQYVPVVKDTGVYEALVETYP